MTVKLWRQCFHGRTDDERDTWCHDVGAKCHCHLQAHQIWQMAICSLRQLVFFASENLFLWNKQFCTCFCLSHAWVYQVTSSAVPPVCVCLFVCCTVEVSLRGWIDSSADRGQLSASGGTSPSLTRRQQQQQQVDPHKPTVSSTITLRMLHTFAPDPPFMFNAELWFVSGMKPVSERAWFFFVCDCMERLRWGSAGFRLITVALNCELNM